MAKQQMRRCPHCGANMPLDAKYCRRCHGKMDTGRIEDLGRPGRSRRAAEEDSLRDLPRPIRPEEEPEDDFFDPELEEQPRHARRSRAREDSRPARPTSTARAPGDPVYTGQDSNKRLYIIAGVLAAVLVVLIVVIVLVVKLTSAPAPAADATPEPSAGVPVISTTMEPSPVPTLEPTPTPEPTATPTPTPEPTATPTPTVAPASGKVYINGNFVSIRKGPGTSYDRLGEESTGYELDKTGVSADGDWIEVRYKDQTGYVSKDYVTETAPAKSSAKPDFKVTAASGKVTVTNSTGATMREGPGTTYDEVTGISPGAVLDKIGTTTLGGGWTQVQYNGHEGFVYNGLLTDGTVTPSPSGSPAAVTGVTSASGTITVTGSGVNVRKGPGTSYDVIGSANSGQTFTVTGSTDGWYQISYSGQTGYISSQYAKKN